MATRLLLFVVLLACSAVSLPAAESLDYTAIEELVHQVNPARNNDSTEYSGFLGDPADRVATDIRGNFWFSLFMFLPFLILPEILLLVVIFKFRDRGDGRQAATFMGNHRLELIWTAIPILTLVIVAFPAVDLLYWQEAPPLEVHTRDDAAMKVDVVGKKFNWLYHYPDHDIQNINLYPIDLRPYGIDYQDSLQETAAFPLEVVAQLNFTSMDVNHNWGVQALGIRKDCIIDTINYAWFKPQRTGFFEGQCYELCGADHGKMVLTVAILTPEDFAHWVDAYRNKGDAAGVVRKLLAMDTAEDGAVAQQEFDAAVAEYLQAGAGPRRLNALRFWTVYPTAVMTSFVQDADNEDEPTFTDVLTAIEQSAQTHRQRLEAALEGHDALAMR